MDVVTLYTTWPDEDSARQCARTLVAERLAACANIIPGVRSVYVWEGSTEEATEAAMLVKTTAASAGAARDRILSIHPYKTGCVVAWPISQDGSNPAYVEWIVSSARR